jgi:hypothetical protein
MVTKLGVLIELDGAISIDFDSAFNIARTLEHVNARRLAAEFAIHRARGGVRDLSRAESVAHTLDDCLSRCSELARSLTDADAVGAFLSTRSSPNAMLRDLDRILGLDLSRPVGRTQDDDLRPYHSTMMGRAMTTAVTESLSKAENSEELHMWFKRSLIVSVGILTDSYVVPPDVLTAKLNKSLGRLEATSSDWMGYVAEHLREKATPVFERQEGASADDITAIRLASLCLAAESDLQDKGTGASLREVAAGITLLGLRATGRAPVTETIVPAVE